VEEIMKKSLAVIRAHLKGQDSTIWGMNCGKFKGGYSILRTEDRTYFEVLILDETSQLILMEFYFNAFCPKEYRNALGGWAMVFNNWHKVGDIRAQTDGTILLSLPIQLNGSPIREELLDTMEHCAIALLDSCEEIVDGLCRGEEADPTDSGVGLLVEKAKRRKAERARKATERQTSARGDVSEDDDLPFPEVAGSRDEPDVSDEPDESDEPDKTAGGIEELFRLLAAVRESGGDDQDDGAQDGGDQAE